MITHAWQVANLSRARSLPALRRLLPKDDPAAGVQSPAEMRKVFGQLWDRADGNQG